MTQTVADSRIHALSIFELNFDNRREDKVIKFAADNGKLNVYVDNAHRNPATTITLDLDQVDQLIENLPELRNWMASGRPAWTDRSEREEAA